MDETEVEIYRDEDGVWIAEYPPLRGCVSQGQTRAEALTNLGDAYVACLSVTNRN